MDNARKENAERAIGGFCPHDLRDSLSHLRRQVLDLADEIKRKTDTDASAYDIRDLLCEMIQNY